MPALQLTGILNNTTIGLSRAVNQLANTTTGEDFYYISQNIGTSEETITIPTDIGNAGWCWLYNSDATNFVEWGISTGAYTGNLKAGEFALFRLDPAVSALYLLANTAACDVEVYILED